MKSGDTEKQVDIVAQALRRVLSEGLPSQEGQRAILIKRIPIICNDIMQIKSDVAAALSEVKEMREESRNQMAQVNPYLEGAAGVGFVYRFVIGCGAIAIAWVAIKNFLHI